MTEANDVRDLVNEYRDALVSGDVVAMQVHEGHLEKALADTAHGHEIADLATRRRAGRIGTDDAIEAVDLVLGRMDAFAAANPDLGKVEVASIRRDLSFGSRPPLDPPFADATRPGAVTRQASEQPVPSRPSLGRGPDDGTTDVRAQTAMRNTHGR